MSDLALSVETQPAAVGMTAPTHAAAPTVGPPVLHVFAVLAAMQDELDELRDAVLAQQRVLQSLANPADGVATEAAGRHGQART
jgi:hypothetical protein